MKKCSKCKESKSLDSYYKDKAFKDGHRSQCKMCDNKRRIGSLYVKNYDLKYRYGIDLEKYNAIKMDHNSCCAICGTHEVDLNHNLCVDHNHLTSEIRGLLCKPCNLVIGNSKENKSILLKAIEYLERYEKS